MDRLLEHIADRTANIAVVGQGYVGLPVAMRAAEVGFDVVGYDLSADRVKALQAGESFVGDVTDETVAWALEHGYRPTSDAADLAGFDVAVISVPTPLHDGAPDLSYIESAGRALGAHLRPGGCVILESTTYPGTTTELLAPILEEESGLGPGQYRLGYSPERIDPGNETHTFVNTPKVTSGVDDESLAAVDQFFAALVDTTVPVGSPAEAELVKLLENTFRHVNIALVNELAMFARELGVDVWRAIDAASTKPFGYMRFTPGPGVGGHCLPIDPSYLAWRVKQHLGHTFRFVELANDVNQHMPDYVHTRITAMLNEQRKSLNGSRVLLLGLAYKRNTSDWRESPSVEVAERLAESGAEVVFCDPHIPEVNALDLRFPLVEFSPGELAGADITVVLVDHAEFGPATIAAHATLAFDTKNLIRAVDFAGEVLSGAVELEPDGASVAIVAEPPATRLVSLRGLAAAMIVFAGAIHLLLAVSRTPGWRVEGVGFAAVGLIQLTAGVGLILTAWRAWLAGVAMVALVPATAWLYTRTVGYPAGPWKGTTLEVHGLEVLVGLAEMGAAAIAVAALLTKRAIVGPAGLRLDTVGPVLLVIAAVPGMVSIEAVDTYLIEPSGRTHVHTGPEG